MDNSGPLAGPIYSRPPWISLAGDAPELIDLEMVPSRRAAMQTIEFESIDGERLEFRHLPVERSAFEPSR